MLGNWLKKISIRNLVKMDLNVDMAYAMFCKYFGDDARHVLITLYNEWMLSNLQRNPNKDEIYKELIELKWRNPSPLADLSSKVLFDEYYDYLITVVLYEESTACFQEWLDTVPIIY